MLQVLELLWNNLASKNFFGGAEFLFGALFRRKNPL
jgi:hypothetical protein